MENLFQKKMSRRQFFQFAGVAALSMFGVFRVIAELNSHAAGTPVGFEPESGTVTGPATKVTDATASGGQALQFGAASAAYPYGPYGSYKPGPTTSGVRAGTHLTPYTNQFGTIGANGSVTSGVLVITTPNVTIEGYDIPAYIYVKAANVTIKNCFVRGPATVPSGGDAAGMSLNLIGCYATAATGTTIIDCTLAPDVPNHNIQGIQGKDFTAERNHVYNTVDGIDPEIGGTINILANYIHDLSWFSPDSNHSSDTPYTHSHNDCIQFEGGSATVKYNNLQAFLSTDPNVGQGSALPYAQANSAMIISSLTNPATTNLVIENNWLDGGQVAINLASRTGTYSNVGRIANNIIGDNQYYDGVTAKCAVAPADMGLTFTGNTYQAVDRPLHKSSRNGTTVDTGNGLYIGF